jgi:hypothetical protein
MVSFFPSTNPDNAYPAAAIAWVLAPRITNRSEIGEAIEMILAKPSHRIDFDVSVEDYDGGRFTVLS